MDLQAGVHLTHGHPLNFSGSLYQFEAYKVNSEMELIDYDALEKQAMEYKPKLIVAGAVHINVLLILNVFVKLPINVERI